MNRRFGLDASGTQTQTGGFFGPPSYASTNVVSTEFINGEDSAFGVNIGASINPNDHFRIGASYRQGPKFDIAYHREDSAGTLIGELHDSQFKVPDVIAVGVLVKPVSALNLTVDYRRVMVLAADQRDGPRLRGQGRRHRRLRARRRQRVPRSRASTCSPTCSSPLSAIALRGGFWHDPDHRIRYEGVFQSDSVLFQPGDSETHYTGGGGIVFEKFQFDVGFDHAETVKTFSVSAVLRF